MKIILTESQLKTIINESEHDRMIAKAKTVYKAFRKGRNKVKVISLYPPLDISYELPDIDKCKFEIDQAWNDPREKQVYIVMYEPVEFTFHNIETQQGESERSIMTHWRNDIALAYKKKFDQFNIEIGEHN